MISINYVLRFVWYSSGFNLVERELFLVHIPDFLKNMNIYGENDIQNLKIIGNEKSPAPISQRGAFCDSNGALNPRIKSAYLPVLDVLEGNSCPNFTVVGGLPVGVQACADWPDAVMGVERG